MSNVRPLATLSTIAALVVLSAATGAHAEDDAIAFDAHGHATRHLRVTPGNAAEACTPLQAGESVSWRYTGSAATDFNIHYHAGKDVVFPAKVPGKDLAFGRLDATVAQTYCWMWENKGATAVELDLQFDRAH